MTSPNPGLLAALLKTGRLTGVMRWKVNLSESAAKDEAQIAKWRCHYFDSAGAKTIEDCLAKFSNEPKLAGISLSNLSESFTNLFQENQIEIPSKVLVVWSGWQDLIEADSSQARIISDCLEQVLQDNSGLVLVVDSQGKFPDLDQLTSA